MSNPNDKDSPVSDEYHVHDVLCGRGGSINSHPGNERFRQLVEKRKRVYLTARFKREKRLIASSIVSEIRNLDPPGRFLSKDSMSGNWEDIGDEKARDKTSQALRENAPSLRAKIETEIHKQRRKDMADNPEAQAPVAMPTGPPPPYYAQWGYYGGFYGGWGPPQDMAAYAQAPAAYPGHPGPYPQGPAYGQPPNPEAQMPPPTRPEVSQSSSRLSKSPKRPPALQQTRSEESKGSALESIPNFVNAVPSSIASWTKNSFSFADDNMSTTSSRRVTFQDSSDRPSKRHQSGQTKHGDRGYTTQSSTDPGSLLSQVANHILGSWDTSGLACAAHPDRVVVDNSLPPTEVTMDEIGQEVELVDDIMEYDAMDAEDDIREGNPEMAPANTQVEIDWPSRVGSCHTWLPEAPSFFSMGGQNPLSPSASLEMDHSAAGVSLVGSFSQVFKEEGMTGTSASHDPMLSPKHSMNHRVLNQIPSWERSFRSHSPSTVASDSSFLSKRSETRVLSPRTLSPRNSMDWDQPKIRE